MPKDMIARYIAIDLKARLFSAASALVLLYTMTSTVQAQDADAEPIEEIEETGSFVEEVVVIGNVEQQLIDATNPFTRISGEELELQAPRSIADALINVPSLQIDPSFGATNNQFRFRGIGAGGTQFLELEEDGIPIQRDGPEFFYRISNAIAEVDATRGGVSPLFRTAAVGAVINFKYREGDPEQFEADAFFQASDFGQRRFELFLGGPLANNEQTSFAIAGWYSEDDGIRGVDFEANEGFNLYGSIKHQFADDSGHIKVSARTLQEDNLVYFVGNPFVGSTSDPIEFAGAPDINNGTTLSQEILAFPSFSAPGVPSFVDNTNGEETSFYYIGGEVEKRFDFGLELRARARFTDSDGRFAGQFAAGFAAGGSDFQTGEALASNLLTAGFPSAGGVGIFQQAFGADFNPTSFQIINQSGGVLDFGSLSVTDPNGNGILESGEVTASSLSPTLANGNGIFTPLATFTQENPFESFQIDIEANYSLDTAAPEFLGGSASHRFAFGYYYLDQDTAQDSFVTIFLTDVQEQADRVDVVLTDDATGETASLSTAGVIASNIFPGGFMISDSINAGYFVYDVDFGDLRFDGGVRVDEFESDQLFFGAENAFGGGLTQTPVPIAGTIAPAQLAIQQITGPTSPNPDGPEIDEIFASYTVGANYRVIDPLSVYARYTRSGVPLPSGLSILRQLEGGFRYTHPRVAAAVNVFYIEQESDSVTGQLFDPDTGDLITTAFERDNEVIGVELESEFNVLEQLTVFVNFTYQDPEIATDAVLLSLEDLTVISEEPLDGNTNIQQPNFLGTFDVRYDFDLFGFATGSLNATVRYVGERFLDFANENALEAYTQLNVGLVIEGNGGWYVRASGQNLNNADALQDAFGGPTAGFGTFTGDPSSGFYGRPLFGRNFVFGVGYRF